MLATRFVGSGLLFRTFARPLISQKRGVSAEKLSEKKVTPLYLLRRKTGLPYNMCREALVKCDNDFEKATNWLETQAFAKGQVLQKLGKSTREGLVCLSIQEDNKAATMLELNCETDFVARNQLFQELALNITEQCSLLNDLDENSHTPLQKIKRYKFKTSHLDEQVTPLIAKLGENIRISRAERYLVDSAAQTRLYGQIHSLAAKKNSNQLNIAAGRFGAIIALQFSNESIIGDPAKQWGNRLCHHIIGFSPKYIELPESLRKTLEEAEKSKASDELREDNGEDDCEDHERIVHNTRDDWPSIMDQTLIMSDDRTVREFCEHNAFSITFFKRFECGEED